MTFVNLGLSTFADALRAQGAPVVEIDWRPPPADLVEPLTRLWGDRVAAANAEVVERVEAANPCAVTVAPAREVVPGLGDGLLLHSGPPIEWERVCDPQRRALTAAAVFEGWASDREDAARRLADGEIALAPGNAHDHVGPMTGVCSPSMPVWVVEGDGARAFSTLNEGPGRTLWFGVGDDEAVERLRFFRDELGPTLARLLEHRGPVDVFALAAQGLNMGDELHMRSQATGNLLIRDLAPSFAALGGEASARFVTGNHHFFLNLTMAACKCAWLSVGAVPGSSVVSVMARNGTEMGLQLAGLPGRWFTAPAAPVQDQLLREGHGPDDAALDIGDSAVIECTGLGGMALAAAPAVAAFFGGDAAAAAARTELMAEICVRRSSRFTIAARGTGVGIDVRLVAELGITPQITTGVLHVSAGKGQIGAGVAHQPLEPFREALLALDTELA
ncbi:MAG TPA: DUF1116 domain-containing protein, partial [Solirubrobacteraceae bacterium]|nr:DUF1116 domain-containing protein [Solirubrobacteraceae bacterium]